MDRIETSATADANGMVHIDVGVPGRVVHVVVEAATDPLPGAGNVAFFYSMRLGLAAQGAWIDHDEVPAAIRDGRR